jgi:hypothetical protein
MYMLNNGGAQAAAFPDVCLTPIPEDPNPASIPYPNSSDTTLADPATIAEEILVVGLPALNLASVLVSSEGDDLGTELGVVSKDVMGPVTFLLGSTSVTVNGVPAVRLSCPTGHNGEPPNAEGTITTPSQLVVVVLS